MYYVTNGSPDRSFPTPAELLPCMPGTYNPSFASTTCLACPRGSYQSRAGQSRCDPCRVGFTTREMGSLNVSACVPIIPDDFDYPANMTCDELLTTYASIDDKVLIGDGLCNRGPLNTPNCGYDGACMLAYICVLIHFRLFCLTYMIHPTQYINTNTNHKHEQAATAACRRA